MLRVYINSERENSHVTMRREIIENSFVLSHDQNTWKDNHVSEQQVGNINRKKHNNRPFFSSSSFGYKVKLLCINVDRCFFSCQHLVLSILLFFIIVAFIYFIWVLCFLSKFFPSSISLSIFPFLILYLFSLSHLLHILLLLYLSFLSVLTISLKILLL